MNAWFGPDVAVWFSFLSLLSLAAVLDLPAQRGKHEGLVTGALKAGVALGVGLLGLAAAAALLDQPWYVLFPFLVTGVVVTPAFIGGLHSARGAYRAAEARRIVARNL
jgi:hypothetical protein